jgi:hypothetical protein
VLLKAPSVEWYRINFDQSLYKEGQKTESRKWIKIRIGESNERRMLKIIWSDYLQYRAQVRGFNLNKIEDILRYSDERYYDTETNRLITVGKHDNQLVIIPYERENEIVTPITIHATTRQQIQFRLKNGRFEINE